MRIEAFLEQSPVFQVSRMARRMEASLNEILQAEELTFFEALMLAAIFFETPGWHQAFRPGVAPIQKPTPIARQKPPQPIGSSLSQADIAGGVSSINFESGNLKKFILRRCPFDSVHPEPEQAKSSASH